MSTTTISYIVGDVIDGPTRPISLQRAGWYSIGLFSGATGVLHPIQKNIHTDHEYARTQGLSAAIADGMHSTNWLSALLGQTFGADYLVNGSLRTKYIKPTLLDVPLTARLEVTARTEVPEGIRYEFDAWIEDGEGTRLTVGDAAVTVTGS